MKKYKWQLIWIVLTILLSVWWYEIDQMHLQGWLKSFSDCLWQLTLWAYLAAPVVILMRPLLTWVRRARNWQRKAALACYFIAPLLPIAYLFWFVADWPDGWLTQTVLVFLAFAYIGIGGIMLALKPRKSLRSASGENMQSALPPQE